MEKGIIFNESPQISHQMKPKQDRMSQIGDEGHPPSRDAGALLMGP